MTRKRFLIFIVALLLIGGISTAYILSRNDNKVSDLTETQPVSRAQINKPDTSIDQTITLPLKPCDILGIDDAKKILGQAAIVNDLNKNAPSKSENVSISTCSYGLPDNSKLVSLLVRVAINAEGATHDKDQFGPNKPVNAQEVKGYGDAAYWDVNFRQLNILKGFNWYVLTSGPSETKDRTLEQAKQTADLIISKF